MPRKNEVYNFGVSKHFDDIRKENREFFDNWLNALEVSNKSPQTIYQYSSAMKIFFSWNYEFNNDKLFTEMMNRDFSAFVAYQRKTLKVGSTRTNFFKCILSSLSKFIEKEYEDVYPTFKNKAQNIENVSGSARRKKVIIDKEMLQTMLDTLVDKHEFQLACWLALLAYSGCRRSEAIQMRVEWFTPAYEKFPAPHTMYKTPEMRTKGKGEEGKRIPKYIFKQKFDPYLKLWLTERERLGITNEHLFVSSSKHNYFDPTILTANTFASQIDYVFNNGFHNHCMRHFFATTLKSEHVPNDIILKIVRWENESMINTYDDTDDDVALEEYFNNLKSRELTI